MNMKNNITCPLGHICRTPNQEGGWDYCAWFVPLRGPDPQDKNKSIDEYRCAMAWMPTLLVEINGNLLNNVVATEETRNEVAKSAENVVPNVLGIMAQIAHANQQHKLN